MKNIILIIICIQLFIGCKPKLSEIVLSGTLLNENGEPLSYYSFELRKKKPITLSPYLIENNYKTDANGNFQFTFNASSDCDYLLSFNETFCNFSKWINIEKKSNNKINVTLISKRFVNLYLDEKHIGDSVSFNYRYFNNFNTLNYKISETNLIKNLDLPTQFLSQMNDSNFSIFWKIYSDEKLVMKDSIFKQLKSCDTFKIVIQ